MKKEEKPKLVRAEVIDNMVALNVGDNVYKPFFKGAIVEIDEISFRNLCRDGRVKAASAEENNSRKGARTPRRSGRQASSPVPAVAEPRPNGPEAHLP